MPGTQILLYNSTLGLYGTTETLGEVDFIKVRHFVGRLWKCSKVEFIEVAFLWESWENASKKEMTHQSSMSYFLALRCNHICRLYKLVRYAKLLIALKCNRVCRLLNLYDMPSWSHVHSLHTISLTALMYSPVVTCISSCNSSTAFPAILPAISLLHRSTRLGVWQVLLCLNCKRKAHPKALQRCAEWVAESALSCAVRCACL